MLKTISLYIVIVYVCIVIIYLEAYNAFFAGFTAFNSTMIHPTIEWWGNLCITTLKQIPVKHVSMC